MDNETLFDRINFIAKRDYDGSLNQLCKELDLPTSAIYKLKKEPGKQLNSDTLKKFYPKYNLNWLITGEDYYLNADPMSEKERERLIEKGVENSRIHLGIKLGEIYPKVEKALAKNEPRLSHDIAIKLLNLLLLDRSIANRFMR